MNKFERMCAIRATRMVFNDGWSPSDISKRAGRTESTIRRWLLISGLHTTDRSRLPNHGLMKR